jgi:membrane protein
VRWLKFNKLSQNHLQKRVYCGASYLFPPITFSEVRAMNWFTRAARWRPVKFIHFIGQRFIDDNCLQVAASLAYTTLLSLVPLMAVMLNVFSAFPAFSALEADIRNFIFSNFVPAAGEAVATYLDSFTRGTSKLTAVGIVALIITALLLLRTIDHALNHIWRSRRRRAFLRNFTVYWAILSLGPFLVGLGIVATSTLMSQAWLDVDAGTRNTFLIWLPFLTSATAFALIYLLIPNRRVPWPAALAGGLIAALLFEAGKRAFALYVTHSDVYQTIYGALATVPIFLLWIYFSWVLILLGAEITYCLAHIKGMSECEGVHENDSNFLTAYRLLGYLWRAQCHGQTVMVNNLPLPGRDVLPQVLTTLENAAWVYRKDENNWGLARDLGEICLRDLYQLMAGGLARLPERSDAWSQNLYPLLLEANRHNNEIMAVPLKDLYRQTDTKPSPSKKGA